LLTPAATCRRLPANIRVKRSARTAAANERRECAIIRFSADVVSIGGSVVADCSVARRSSRSGGSDNSTACARVTFAHAYADAVAADNIARGTFAVAAFVVTVLVLSVNVVVVVAVTFFIRGGKSSNAACA
jgi:hypothetical protein